ncbi:MAG: C_GCAxxG_C_C family protein [Clostridia bacterium]|nr:C_GCAxxG_C_C family protein [Clostridia bacterium]
MSSRMEEAAAKKKSGRYNCAQAVACTFCDKACIDEETMRQITQAFGVGMGTLEGNCGALTGAGVILGMVNKDQRKTVADIRAIMTAFKERNGTVTCKTLKGVGTGVILRECDDCVRDAVEFLENRLNPDDCPLEI